VIALKSHFVCIIDVPDKQQNDGKLHWEARPPKETECKQLDKNLTGSNTNSTQTGSDRMSSGKEEQ